ncbi:MAG: hypothetical protein J0H17_14675 [Rhizobiales bacterium]|nr:hypothetical protein [Hyphomicrobiales bacterium]
MALSVAQVDAIVKAAPAGEIVLPEYEGLPGDLDYLRNYVLAAVTARYNVDASVFDTANLLSTTILRDFLHRAVYDHPDLPIYQDVHPGDDQYAYQTDVGALFREKVFVQCGIISWQLQNIYQSLGYESTLYNTFNGEDGLGTADSYNDGHVRVEVYLDDYDKLITQDATYNWLFVDADTGQPLSYREAQIINFTDAPDLIVDDTGIRTYVGTLHIDGLPPGFMGGYLIGYMKGAYAWLDDGVYSQVHRDLFLDYRDAHTEVFVGAYATVQAAVADVMNLHSAGESLLGITDALRDDHQVSGFRLLSLDGQSVVGDFVTLQLIDGDYVSINIDTGEALNGSYDQIYDDLTGGNRGLNPGVDISGFFNPAVFVLYNGTVEGQWDIAKDNPLLVEMQYEQNSRATITDMPDGHAEYNYYDSGSGQIWDQVTALYNDQGALYWQTTQWDNGAYSARPYDWTNVQPYQWFEYTWDHTGQLIYTRYMYDDNTSVFTYLDPNNKEQWAKEEMHYNAANQLTADAINKDDGSWLVHHYDPANEAAWASYDTWIDPQGRITRELINFDDGHTEFRSFDFPMV